MAPAEPLQMWAYTGEYRRARPLFRRRAEECRVRGHVPLQAINLAFEASCLVTLGEIRAGAEVLGDALRLLDSIVDAPRYATIVRRPQYELALAREEGWDSMLALGMEAVRAPDPANNWVRAATFSSGARVLAALGHHDLALGCIAETVPALNRAPAWATHFTSVPCDDADALWVLGRPDHADAVERALRETVLPADFRWPMTDARRGLAQLCSLTHRYDEAVMWFQAARETLEQQASRTLRAIIDYDEALMYARRRQSGDRNRACALLDAALRQFEALEMPGWRTKAQALEREML
jgi:tetratricopeptide (TPR) repeat protein